MTSRIAWVTPEWMGLALAMREACVKLTLSEIGSTFGAELAPLKPEHAARRQELALDLGERKALAHVWLERIGWTSRPPEKLGEVLVRLRDALLISNADAWPPVLLEVERAGWSCDGYGPLVGAADVWDVDIPAEAPGIGRELARLNRALRDDDLDLHGVVGFSKNLVEATAKFVLSRSEGFPRSDPKYREVVADANTLLIAAVPDSAPDALREFVRNLGEAVAQLGAVRNRTEGSSGHGSPELADWVSAPIVRLEAEVAAAWVRFALALD